MTKQIIFVTGVRRFGKSTLMKQNIKIMIDKGEKRKNLILKME